MDHYMVNLIIKVLDNNKYIHNKIIENNIKFNFMKSPNNVQAQFVLLKNKKWFINIDTDVIKDHIEDLFRNISIRDVGYYWFKENIYILYK